MINLKTEILKYLTYCSGQKELSSHTLKAYRIDLFQYESFKADISLDKCELTSYIYYLHEKFSPKTVRRKIASLKAFVSYLYSQDIILNNPFDKINTKFKEPMVLPRIIPGYIIQDILNAAYINIKTAPSVCQKKNAIRNAAILELLFVTGARISEICSLKTYNVDLDNKTVKFMGKGSRERIIQIEHDEVLSILDRYRNIFSNHISHDGYFFLNNRHNRFSEQSVRIVIKKLEKQIHSNTHITPHMFRHSMATMLLEEDVDIRYIQKILGHSSITTTQIYTHVTSAKQKEILRTKHPRNKIRIER